MSTERARAPQVIRVPPRTPDEWRVSELLRQYGCGPIIDPRVATARERFEAFAHSVRDVLAQRLVLTRSTYNKANPKRVYYLSMEFLLGRWLANNITDFLLSPLDHYAAKENGFFKDLMGRIPILVITACTALVGAASFGQESYRRKSGVTA